MLSESLLGENLSIVIPAFNEEGAVKKVLQNIIKELPEAEVIFVDDGSTDATVNQAVSVQSDNIHVYQHTFNRGYGSSLKSGMSVASKDYIAWFDADGEHKVSDLKNMYLALAAQRVGAIIAQRKSASATRVRGIGKWLIWSLAKSLRIDAQKDLNCGLRIFRRSVILPYLSILPNRYSASLTTTILLTERDYPVAYFPITTGERVGTSKVKLKDGFSSMIKVVQLVTLFAPLRLFFKPGLFAIFVGLVYGVYVSLTQKLGFPVAGVILCVLGMLLCLVGLMSDQISQLRLENRNNDGLLEKVK